MAFFNTYVVKYQYIDFGNERAECSEKSFKFIYEMTNILEQSGKKF